MKKSVFLCFCIWVISCTTSSQNAEIKMEKQALYPRYREWVNLSEGNNATVNSPALLFPATSGKSISYRVFLSQDSTFLSSETITSPLIPWAMFSPHSLLKAGNWYWKYEVYSDAKRIKQSTVFHFKVKDTTRQFVTPTIDDFLNKVRAYKHPRLYVNQSEISHFRAVNQQDKEALRIIKRAKKQLTMPLPEEKPTRPRDTTGMTKSQKKVMMRFMYHKFGDKVKEPIKDLCMAYLLTNKKKFIKTAIKQAVHLSKMDMAGVATSEDFNNASVMLGMAIAYDTGYEWMTNKEKKQLKSAIQKRGNYFFHHYVNKFETHSMDNHVWQHTLRRFLFTSISMLDEIPEAKKWLSYCYEVWTCRFPILGGDDGGWHDGSSYFQVNFETFIYVPFILSKITGIDFFDMPYFQRLPQFLIYSFPPSSYSTGFGDGAENMLRPTKKYLSFADALARETGNGYARWYADKLMKGNVKKLYKCPEFAFYRLLSNMNKKEKTKAVSPQKLPQSLFFPNAGFALMHNDVANAKKDVMASFMSVPFGATGHAHAAHNGFGINVGGKQMFGGSGYYTNFNDPHTLKHYRTRGHNTILVNGLAQCIGENGYGWIARFANTEKFTYALGDATHAYDKMTTPFWIDRMKRFKVAYTKENGFGNPNVKRFRRHFVFLRPNIIVIYDELEAKNKAEWTWLLHSYQKIDSTKNPNIVLGKNAVAKSKVQIFASSQLESEVHDRFFSPALNWKKKGSDVDVFPNHWHAEFTPNKKMRKCFFLTVIELKFNTDSSDFESLTMTDGKLKLKNWTINANLDTSKSPMLKIVDNKGEGVYYNVNNKNTIERSTIIQSNGKQKELIDLFPCNI